MNELRHGSLRDLRDPIAVVAFSGWNDASEAATDALNALVGSDPHLVFELDPDDFYDFQTTRPTVGLGESGRVITWPTTQVLRVSLPERDLIVVRGPEPNLRWRSFAASLLSVLKAASPRLVIVLGAMLTDTPHTRPVPIHGSTSDPQLAERLDLADSNYEGPTGMTGVLSDGCAKAGLPTVSLWASVPHYVANPPNPKAALALLMRIEDLLGHALNLGDLPERAETWERHVDELAADDPEVAEYIASLEEQSDEGLPHVSGDAIAAEIQRYLHRRNG